MIKCLLNSGFLGGWVVVGSLFPNALIFAEQTIYRYLPYENAQAPAQVSNRIVSESVLAPVVSITRGLPAHNFQDFRYGEFRGAERYVFQSFAPVSALAGSFTVTAYLRIADFNTVVVDAESAAIVSNYDPNSGVGLQLLVDSSGTLSGNLWMKAASGSSSAVVFRSLQAPKELQEGVWYRVVYRYERDPGNANHFHDLWIDHHRVAEESFPFTVTRSDSGLSPLVGAQRSGPVSFSHHINADIHAVQIDGYAQSDYYLTSPQIRDGSTYFGGMEYQDYLGLSDSDGKIGGKPLERRMFETYYNIATGNPRYGNLKQRLTGRWILPFQNDGYIVQGIAADEDKKRVFIAMYHRTVSGTSYTYPSMVVEVSMIDGQLRNVFVLRDENNIPMGSHVGGIAYWDGYLFVPDRGSAVTRDPDLFVYDISGYDHSGFDPATMEGFSPVDLAASHRIVDPLGTLIGESGRFNSLSFMGIHYDHQQEIYLHIGNFQRDHAADTHFFRLEFDVMDGPQLNYTETIQQSNRRSQGMTFYMDVPVGTRLVKRALLATSFGNNDSVIHSSIYLDGGEPAVSSEFLRLPAGLEEIDIVGDRLWGQSESGSLHFQKRPSNPWTDTFPFLFVVDINSLIDANGNGISDAWYARRGLNQNVDPHSDLDGDGFTVWEEYLADTDPRDPEDFPFADFNSQAMEIRVPGSFERFYTLEQSYDLEHWEAAPGLERQRGVNDVMSFPLETPGYNIFYRIITER